MLTTNLHFRRRSVPRRVGEAELEAVGRRLHVGGEHKHHSAPVHVPLGETALDVGSLWDETTGFNPAQHNTDPLKSRNDNPLWSWISLGCLFYIGLERPTHL